MKGLHEKDDRHTILIVDDELQVIKALKRTLRNEPYSTLCTTLPEEALVILQQYRVDVIVSDQVMPDISGIQLLKHSRRISPGTVRILMTGYSDIDTIISSINDGNIFYYISKPWNNENFKAAIKKAIEYSYEQKEKEEKLNAALYDKKYWMELAKKMKEQVIECNQQSISALINVVKAKDIDLYRHSERVAKYALRIADMMGLSDRQKQNIEYAAYFHDIGKIGIKDNILDKPGKLNEIEYNEIKRHPLVGAEIIKEIEYLKEISEIICQHHEHIDGSGYPNGLSGSEIKLEARIICVADTFDALISDRVYRAGLDEETACNILRIGRNLLYDPEIVDIFLGGVQNEQNSVVCR